MGLFTMDVLCEQPLTVTFLTNQFFCTNLLQCLPKIKKTPFSPCIKAIQIINRHENECSKLISSTQIIYLSMALDTDNKLIIIAN
jgi:hypothetical protein